MFFEMETHFAINLFSFVFKMALSKVDLSKQIIILQNVGFNMQYFQLSDFIFD